MDIQDVYNDKKELIGIKKYRDEFNEDEYSMSCFIWIINEEGKMLIQQRSLKDDNKPGSYGITGGAVDAGETSLIAALRELKEELGLVVDKKELIYIGTERRKRKFFEYYFLNTNKTIEEMKLNEEVEKVEWITLEDYENNISNAINFQMFKNYYLNIYLEEKVSKYRS
ncbi:MAG: NUDIX domain-containing protein [Lactobacillales bacterium]|nr:NUDIX domain-containing protein [Lactobacillales bacterium]